MPDGRESPVGHSASGGESSEPWRSASLRQRLVDLLPWSGRDREAGQRGTLVRERVSQRRVVNEWLRRELAASEESESDDPTDVPEDSRAALDALLSVRPGAAGFIWRDGPIEWYRVDLTASAVRDLRPVGGPEDMLWRRVSTDGTLTGVAERIHEAGDAVAVDAGIDVRAITDYRDQVAAGDAVDPLVVHTRRGRSPWLVADGNHRSVGVELHRLETGEFEPVPAYLGVTGNPVLRPLSERVRGWLERLRGRGRVSPRRR